MMSPSYERSYSGRRLSFQSSLGSLSRRRNADSDSFRVTDVPFAELHNEYSSDDEDSKEGPIGRENRSLFLRSYQFSRKETLPQKLRSSLRRLKAAAWAVLACNYMPSLARRNHDLSQSGNMTPFNTGHCMPANSNLHLGRTLQVST